MKKVLIFSALFLLASVSLSAQVVKGAGLWYFNGLPNVTPSVATGTEVAYSINNKSLFKWNRTTSAWVAVVQDSSITNELQDLILSGDTLSLTLSDSVILMAQYRNHVWEITNLSDTTSITGDIEGDIAYTSTGDTIAFRGASAWLPFTGGGGGGTFNSFNIAGDTGSDIVTDGQTVTVAGGYGINTAESGGTVTVTADTSQLATQSDISGFGTMSSFTVAAGSGTPQTITNGNTLTMSEGYGINTLAAATDNVQTEVDTTQIATQNDISGLPSGSGTNQRIVVWTGTNSQGNSTQLQSAAGVTLDANLAYRITGGTTASRPTGAAGMFYYNTSNNWFDLHNGTSWLNPLRSATNTGLGTSTHVGYFDANGLMTGSSSFTWSEALKRVVISGGTIPTGGNVLNITGTMPTVISSTTYGVLINILGAGSSNSASLAFRVVFGPNYTGPAPNAALSFYNSNTGTGTDIRSGEWEATPYGNSGFTGFAAGTTTGTNYGGYGEALRGNLNIGLFGAAKFGKNSAANIGILGLARNTGTSPVEVGGFFGLNTTNPTWVSAALVADNGASTSPIFLAKDNQSTVFSIVDGGAVATTSTVQVGSYTGTANGIAGKTSTGILTIIPEGYGINLTAGGSAEVDTTQIATQADLVALGAGYLPLTLTGATEVNTAGQTLYFRDAAGYPFTFMNSNYWLAASGVNNYIDVGSTASNVKIISDGLIELNSSVNTSLITTGRLLVDSDSIVIDATLPANTNATSVLVRDAVTKRLEEKAIGSVGTWLKPELEAGNDVVIASPGGNELDISGIDFFYVTAENGMELSSLGAVLIQAAGNIQFLGDTIEVQGAAKITDITNGDATSIAGFNSGNVATTVVPGAGINLTSGEIRTTQSFFNSYDDEINLTGVTTTADTIRPASNTKSNDWSYGPTTYTHTYNGTASRYFSISVSAQVESPNCCTKAYIEVYKNGTVTSAKSQGYLTDATAAVTLHGQSIVLLSTGDTINAKFYGSEIGGEDYDILNYSLIVIQL